MRQDVGDGFGMEPNQSASREGSFPVGGEDAAVGCELQSFLDSMNVDQAVGVAEDMSSVDWSSNKSKWRMVWAKVMSDAAVTRPLNEFHRDN